MKDFTKYLEHELLRADATEADAIRLFEEAKEYGMYSVCVDGCYVPLARKHLEGSGVVVGTVIGFPLGTVTVGTKAAELYEALEDGEYSIYAYQDGIAYKTAAVSLIKKTDSIIKPNTNELITFGVFRDLVYPISSVYVSSNNINPGNFIGGTWVNKTGIISAGFAWVRTA